MAFVTVLLNRGGGAVSADPQISDKVTKAFSAVGVDSKIELISGRDRAARCHAIAKSGDELVVVGGGDGTISAAASALAGSNTLLGILPLGTLNHFARDLGIPSEIDKAAELIARRPVRRVDVGEMNDRTFINNSAIGLYPLMIINRDLQRQRLGRSKQVAMLVASLETLVRFNHQRLTLTVNDKKANIDTPLLFVGNNDYRVDLGAPGRRERLDEGELSVFVMRKKTRRGFIAASVRAFFNRERTDDMVAIDDVERLRVSSHRGSLAVSFDGEVVRVKPPLDYRIRKKALRVVAP